MAKFKRTHESQSVASGMITKVGIFAGILGALYFAFNSFIGNGNISDAVPEVSEEIFEGIVDFLPSSTTGEIIKHSFYTLSYSEKYEQAEWVAYELTKESLQIPNVKRTGNFRPDPKCKKASASHRDYSHSGYDRGHMAPAGDMAFSEDAMSESFYMSNMSPQIRNFNGGIWRELEEQVRDWAYKNKRVYVVSGPVLTQEIREYIGTNEVAVPDMYFKVILDLTQPERKAIAFLLPNEISYQHLAEYVVTIDKVEELTGIDFFAELLDEDLEENLESNSNGDLWEFSKKRFDLRTKSWNKRKHN